MRYVITVHQDQQVQEMDLYDWLKLQDTQTIYDMFCALVDEKEHIDLFSICGGGGAATPWTCTIERKSMIYRYTYRAVRGYWRIYLNGIETSYSADSENEAQKMIASLVASASEHDPLFGRKK